MYRIIRSSTLAVLRSTANDYLEDQRLADRYRANYETVMKLAEENKEEPDALRAENDELRLTVEQLRNDGRLFEQSFGKLTAKVHHFSDECFWWMKRYAEDIADWAKERAGLQAKIVRLKERAKGKR